MERYFNNYQTTVAPGGYTSGSGLLNVLSTSGITLNAGDTCRLSLYTGSPELVVILIVSAVNSGSQFAVTAEGTDVSASAGDLVLNTLTVGAMNQIRSDISLMGPYANLPSPGSSFLIAGQRFKATDGPYEFIYDGTVWKPFVMGYEGVLPIAGNFSWVNQGGATVVFTAGFGLITAPANSGTSLRLQVETLPSTPFTVDAQIAADNATSNNNACGLCLYDSGSGKVVTLHMVGPNVGGTTPGEWQVIRWNNTGSFSGVQKTAGAAAAPLVLGFLSIEDDGTNLNFYIGYGASKYLCYTEAVGAFITPTHIGFFSQSGDSNPVSMALFSWFQH
jgi:hypothetical protein